MCDTLHQCILWVPSLQIGAHKNKIRTVCNIDTLKLHSFPIDENYSKNSRMYSMAYIVLSAKIKYIKAEKKRVRKRKIKTTNGFRLNWYHQFFFEYIFFFFVHFFISFVDQFGTEWLNDLINAILYTLNPLSLFNQWTTQTNFLSMVWAVCFFITSFWFEILSFSHFALRKKERRSAPLDDDMLFRLS